MYLCSMITSKKDIRALTKVQLRDFFESKVIRPLGVIKYMNGYGVKGHIPLVV